MLSFRFIVPLLLFLAGCQHVPRPSSVTGSVDLPVYPRSPVVTVTVRGMLTSSNGCLFLRNASNQKLDLLIWPEGSRFDGRTVVLHISGRPERAFTLGQMVTVEGSLQDWQNVSDAMGLGNFRSRCSTTPFFITNVS